MLCYSQTFLCGGEPSHLLYGYKWLLGCTLWASVFLLTHPAPPKHLWPQYSGIRLSTELGRTEGTDFSLFPSRSPPFDNASPRRVEPLAKTNNARSGKTRRIKNMAKCGRSYVTISMMPQAQCNAPAQVRTSELRCHLPMLDKKKKHGGILLVLSVIPR